MLGRYGVSKRLKSELLLRRPIADWRRRLVKLLNVSTIASMRFPARTLMNRVMRMTPWALMISIGVALAGCDGKRTRAPQLTLPQRPQLTTLSREKWRAVDEGTRVTLTNNQELLHQYIAKLELIVLDYEAWRTNTSN